MRVLVALLLLAAGSSAEWHASMADARKAARRALKPILCVVLGDGDDLADRLERDPIRPLLDKFVCLRLRRSESVALVARYNLDRSPSTIIYSALGIPMKLVIGPRADADYASVLAEAARRHEAMVTPRKGGRVTLPDGTVSFIHSGLCPRHCPTCTPTLTRALRWLAKRQRPDGTWPSDTALAALALLAEGDDYGLEVRKAKHALMNAPPATVETALFLAEAEVRAPTEELRAILTRLAGEIAESPRDAGALVALNHLRGAGASVSEAQLARAVECARADEAAATTGRRLLALMPHVERARLEPTWAWYRRHYRRAGDDQLLFTALALTARSADAALDFHHSYRDRLLAAQRDDGSWQGSIRATALACVALQLPFGELKLATRRRPRETAAQTPDPQYLKLPHPACRAKVFIRDERYWVDLVVSLDRPADAAYLRQLEEGLRGANRKLFDVTDGQMSLHRVDVYANRGRWDRADVRISKAFYDERRNPLPWAHGVTSMIGLKAARGPLAGTVFRFGQWILFPPEGVWWSDPRYQHVLAHELGHYLFGAPDEYGNGQSLCPCIQGIREHTELCTEETHRDKRQPDACWILAQRSYPRLRIPDTPDPGPWDPPVPRIEIHR